jgi:hypothetical protein
MTPAACAVWVLVLQTAAYISFLNLGLQTAIGRYVAYADEKRDTALRAQAVELPASAWNGVFIGLQRFENAISGRGKRITAAEAETR